MVQIISIEIKESCVLKGVVKTRQGLIDDEGKENSFRPTFKAIS